jgi:hypothetical protein
MPLASTVSHEIYSSETILTVYVDSSVNALAPSLAMAVNPTNLASTNGVGNGDAADGDAQVIGRVANTLGFANISEFEEAQDRADMAEIERQLQENSALLAASGDNYPFAAQFMIADGANDIGLHFDPHSSENERFESTFTDNFIDFSDFGMYAT